MFENAALPPGPLFQNLRPEASLLPQSGISAIIAHSQGIEGLIPLWLGEGDQPTPDFIVRETQGALAAGETFYTRLAGLPELREAITRYMARSYGGSFRPEQFFVTAGGMQAVQIALRIAAGNGDEVIFPTPAWPNFIGAARIAGAQPVAVPMSFGNAGWTLDLARLAAAVTPQTRAIVIISPSNPSGWTAAREELAAILALARKHGLWIIADEIYGRFTYDAPRAPSFHDVMQPDDRVMFVQTLSKNWSMTGWRVGWLEAPAAFSGMIDNLQLCSASGVAAFMQRGAAAALDGGDAFIAAEIARCKTGRDLICEALEQTGRARFTRPEGAFYLFFAINGIQDSARAALDIASGARVGLAPGAAFGPGGEAFFRLCFARSHESLREASGRLAAWLKQ